MQNTPAFMHTSLTMTSHRGDMVSRQIIRHGMKKVMLAKRLGITRQALDYWLKQPDLAIDKVLKIGKLIDYDFSHDLPELKDIRKPKVTSEEQSLREALAQCREEKEALMKKYVELLEKYNGVLGK